MIRDYPDIVPGPLSPGSSSIFDTPNSSAPSSPTSSVTNLSLSPQPLGPLPPPPRHPTMNMQTTYTPYVPRARRGRVAPPTVNPLSPSGQHVPLITSSSQGGVTTRHTPTTSNGLPHDAGPSAALLDKVRALDNLPRLGALRTLDLKGNDLRVSASYQPFGLSDACY